MASENFGNGGDGKKKGGYRGKRDGDRRDNGRGGRDGKGFRTSDRRSGKDRGKGFHDGKDRRQRRDGTDDGFRRHDARSRSDRAHPKNRSDRRDERARPEPKAPVQAQEAPKEQNLTIPSTPQRILFKGVDCEVNGRKDLAMVLYLHGAAQMSLGCENNMLRILREAGPKEFRTIRGRVAGSCPEDAMIAFDYLCATLDDGYDTGLIDTAADAGNALAIYDRIRLGKVEGDDPCIDTFAASDNEKMVEEGLKLLVRKKDSAKAESLLKNMEQRKKLRQSVRVEFIRAMKGDRSSLRRLDELSAEFPEAAFLRGYIDTDDRESYIREGMPRFEDTVMSVVHELDIADTAYGKYLSALKLRADGEEWIPSMINAAGAGSDDAIGELMPVQNRKDVRKAMASVYLRRNDAAGIVRCYDGEDTSVLERYCAHDPARMVEVGRLMGGSRQIDWLKKGFLDGVEECRDELVSMARSGEHNNKQLVYTLHDIGAELESAKLYFAMYGDKSLPSVKWLAKVCADEEAKEYVRSKFEEMGDLRTFDSIFVDDGYESRGNRKGGKGGQRGDRRPRRNER